MKIDEKSKLLTFVHFPPWRHNLRRIGGKCTRNVKIVKRNQQFLRLPTLPKSTMVITMVFLGMVLLWLTMVNHMVYYG